MRRWILAILLAGVPPGLLGAEEAAEPGLAEVPAPGLVEVVAPGLDEVGEPGLAEVTAPGLTEAARPEPPSPEAAPSVTPAAESAAAVTAAPAAPDAPTMAEAIAAAPDGPDGDDLVPTPDPVDPEFELKLLHQDMEAEVAALAVDDDTLQASSVAYIEAVVALAGTVDESRIRGSVARATAPAAPSIAAEAKGPPGKRERHLKGYRVDLQRAFMKYGSDGTVPASSVRWLAETYDRRVVEVAHDLRQMARNAGVVIPDVERTDPPPPEPTTPAVIPMEAVAEAKSPELQGAYLHALERVVAKYELVRLVPESSLRFLSKVHERTPEQVIADLKTIAKPETDSVLPDYAY
jgi:hypothetical protein